MLREEPIKVKEYSFIAAKVRDYAQLMKPNLSFMVVFSSVVGYLMVPGVPFEWKEVIILFIGGMLVTNAANIINQILERFSDRHMKRTMLRPLPDERMGLVEAWSLCTLSAAAGVMLLAYYFNISRCGPQLYFPFTLRICLYPDEEDPSYSNVYRCYTGCIATAYRLGSCYRPAGTGWLGAFPDPVLLAVPAFLGDCLGGVRRLPESGYPYVAFQRRKNFLYRPAMYFLQPYPYPLAMLPNQLGLSGRAGMWVSIAAALLYCFASFIFYIRNDRTSAKRLMYASFIFLPTVLLALLIDKL